MKSLPIGPRATSRRDPDGGRGYYVYTFQEFTVKYNQVLDRYWEVDSWSGGTSGEISEYFRDKRYKTKAEVLKCIKIKVLSLGSNPEEI